MAPIFARGFRAALVTGAAAGMIGSHGPAVIVVDPAGRVGQASVGAAAQVAELGGGALGEAPLPLACAPWSARPGRTPRVEHTEVPRMRLRTRRGAGSSPTPHR